MKMSKDVAIAWLTEHRYIKRVADKYLIAGVSVPIDEEGLLSVLTDPVDSFSVDVPVDGNIIYKPRACKVYRRIEREEYHSAPRDYDTALSKIAPDADGIVRSWGIEYEIYGLSQDQEDALVDILLDMPDHVIEWDASLSHTGLEIIFMPMSFQQAYRVVLTLNRFVTDYRVQMDARSSEAGMHITYGISKASSSLTQMQGRLNRIAFMLSSVLFPSQIEAKFGRSFGEYREMPYSITTMLHSNAFSVASREGHCWECRLPNWKLDMRFIRRFFKEVEWVFNRPPKEEDFVSLVQFLYKEME